MTFGPLNHNYTTPLSLFAFPIALHLPFAFLAQPYSACIQEPVIPPTITDQIRLWEMERDRLTFMEGVCMHVCVHVCQVGETSLHLQAVGEDVLTD